MISKLDGHRFIWLDSLRGIASIIVMIFHYHHFYLKDSASRGEIPDISEFPYAFFLGVVFEFGHLAVELFWVISGFVFYHIYLSKKTHFTHFFLQRFARLYPLHFITLILVAFIQYYNISEFQHTQIYGNNDTKHFLLQLFFSSSWTKLSHGLSFNGPIWSVSLEIITYLAFFILLFAIKVKPFLLSLLLVALSSFFYFVKSLSMPLISSLAFKCAAYFFFGGVLYCIFKFSLTDSKKQKNVLFFFFIMTVFSFLFELDGELIENIRLSLVCAIMVLLFSYFDFWSSFRVEILKKLGDSSYSIYLVHVPIQMVILTVIDKYNVEHEILASSYLTLPIFTFVCMLVSYYTYKWFEVPSGKLIRRKLGKIVKVT